MNEENTQEEVVTAKKKRGPKTEDSSKLGLVDGIEYFYKEDGRRIDWYKMLKTYFKEHIIFNEKEFPKGTDFTKLNIEDFPDNKLLVKLRGWEELADLRGYISIDYQAYAATRGFVSLKCTIEWEPNFETKGLVKKVSENADAHPDTLKGLAANFPTAIAGNRAFGRAVRKFLKIPILSQDEIDKNGNSLVEAEESNVVSSSQGVKDLAGTLTEAMKKCGVTFEQVKASYIKKGSAEDATPEKVVMKTKAENWESITDILSSPNDTIQVIGDINAFLERNSAKK